MLGDRAPVMEAVWNSVLAVIAPMAPDSLTVSKVIGAEKLYMPAPEAEKSYTPATINKQMNSQFCN